MTASTPTEGEMISKIKEKQRVLLREFEKPAPGSSAAPGGKKTVTPAADKRTATKTSTSRTTPKSYASAVATPSATPTSAKSISPEVVEDELDLEDMFRIPPLPPRDNSVVINERLALEAERRKMRKMIEVFNQQET